MLARIDWPRLLVLAVVSAVLNVATCGRAHAQATAVVGLQRDLTPTTQSLSAVACNAAAGSRWIFWLPTGTQRNVTLDVVFVDADSSAASLDIRCETTNDMAQAADSEKDLPVLTSTSAAGVSKIMRGSWSWVSTTGDAPGSSEFSLQIANIPAPFLGCLFTCGAGGAAADNFTVTARGVNP